MTKCFHLGIAAFFLLVGVSPLPIRAEEPGPSAPRGALQTAAFLPFTGSAAEQGEWIRAGLELGRDKALSALGVSIEIQYEDTVADPKTAMSAYQGLRSRDDFKIAFSYGSGVGIALTAPVNRDKVIQIGLATASPAYRTPDDYTFRNFPSAELESAFLVSKTLNDLHGKEIGIVKIDNDFGVGAAKSFRAEYEKQGGRVLFEESIEPGSTDFKSLVTRLRQYNARYIYIAAYPSEGAQFLKQARQLGMSAQFIASVAILGAKNFQDLAGSGAEGLLISTSTPVFLASKEPSVIEFVNQYREKFHEEPGIQHIFAARAYDAMLLSAHAFKACGKADTDCMREYLFQTRNFIGASGTLSFDRNGDVSNTFSLQQVRNGRLEGY
ncbi:MAG: ABC transporter substrate-binding protein [Deltaproteobacteria bacterium]|nr:ABC transporter substrate-binding protein [Deltaproteobacteria bacterium]